MSAAAQVMLGLDQGAAPLLGLQLDGQWFGVPLHDVQCVRDARALSPTPLAPPHVAGAASLHGRIVMVIDLRRRLRLPPSPVPARVLAVVERRGEYFGLLADAAGDMLAVSPGGIRRPASGLPPEWQRVSTGEYETPQGLLALVDVDALLAPGGG